MAGSNEAKDAKKNDDPNCANECDGMDIKQGQFVTGGLGKYNVLNLLGKGGYGAVYKVQLEGTEKIYAMKAEKKVARRDHTKLNMEIFILKSMADQPDEKCHFARIFDKSKKTNFCMIVMTLLGESLADLKKRRNPPVFSLNTGYASAIQCLEAVEELHKIGFIHRDLKAANYAIGLGPQTRQIFILDFGIARRVVNDKNEIKAPRIKVPFKGTIRFASLATHKGMELGYKDDCESWMFMVADMCNKKGLPWKMEKEKDAVGDIKEKIRTPEGMERLFHGMAVEEFRLAMEYIVKLHYTDKVEYTFLYQCIQKAAQKSKCTLRPPFDWEIVEERENDSDDFTTASESTANTATNRPGTRSAGSKSRISKGLFNLTNFSEIFHHPRLRYICDESDRHTNRIRPQLFGELDIPRLHTHCWELYEDRVPEVYSEIIIESFENDFSYLASQEEIRSLIRLAETLAYNFDDPSQNTPVYVTLTAERRIRNYNYKHLCLHLKSMQTGTSPMILDMMLKTTVLR